MVSQPDSPVKMDDFQMTNERYCIFDCLFNCDLNSSGRMMKVDNNMHTELNIGFLKITSYFFQWKDLQLY